MPEDLEKLIERSTCDVKTVAIPPLPHNATESDAIAWLRKQDESLYNENDSKHGVQSHYG